MVKSCLATVSFVEEKEVEQSRSDESESQIEKAVTEACYFERRKMRYLTSNKEEYRDTSEKTGNNKRVAEELFVLHIWFC